MNRNVVISIDDNYVEAAIIMLHSLVKQSQGKRINLFILNDGLSIVSKGVLNKLYSSSFDIHFIKVNSMDFEQFHLSNHVSHATYYRLVISELLPTSINRILYLDCDLIITNQIDYLFNVDLNDHELSAAPNSLSNPDHLESLIPSDNHIYFNAGMLILDLNKMRDNQSAKKLMAIAREYGDKLRFWDQDVLNLYYHSNYNPIPRQYNFMPGYFKNNEPISMSDIHILHFAGATKPWSTYCQHPLNNIWSQNIPTSTTYRLFHLYKVFVGKLNSYKNSINKTLTRRS